MSKRPKIFEDELRAKRVFIKIERNSKKPYAYLNKPNVKNNKKFDTAYSKEVVIKITGASKNYQQWKEHFDYNIKKSNYTFLEDMETVYDKEDLEFFKNYFNNFGPTISNKNENKKEKREVLQMVFSMKHHETTPPDKLMEAVIKTVKEKYPNNISYFTYHGDTDNPHIHCDIKMSGADGKRIDPRINDLHDMREKFAKNLNDLGIEAYATKKKNRNKEQNLDKEQNFDKKEYMNKLKNGHFEVTDFGKAPYQFDDRKSSSYFVSYKNPKGEITTIWSKELEKLIIENDIKAGEFVQFKKIDKEPIEREVKKRVGKQITTYKKTAFKDVWDCSILGRAEKELRVSENMKKKSEPTYSLEEKEAQQPFVLTGKYSGKKQVEKVKQQTVGSPNSYTQAQSLDGLVQKNSSSVVSEPIIPQNSEKKPFVLTGKYSGKKQNEKER